MDLCEFESAIILWSWTRLTLRRLIFMSSIRVSEVHSQPLVLWDDCQMFQTEREREEENKKNFWKFEIHAIYSHPASIGSRRQWFHASVSSEIPLFVFAHQGEFAHVSLIPPLFVASAILFGLCCKLYCLCTMNNGGNWARSFFFFLPVRVLRRSDGRVRAENRS